MGGNSSRDDNSVDSDDFEELPTEEIHEASDEDYMVVRQRRNGIMYDRYRLHFPN